jgi:hypothetical protein
MKRKIKLFSKGFKNTELNGSKFGWILNWACQAEVGQIYVTDSGIGIRNNLLTRATNFA